MDFSSQYTLISAFIFGTMIGSFTNVCIYRVPLSLNIISPGSHCGKCKTPITWYENVPFLSYMFLRGRCRYCGISIGLIHPLIEILIGLLAFECVRRFGLGFQALYYFVLITALIVASAIDLEYKIIPDSISVGGTVAGLLLAILFQWAGRPWHVTAWDSLLGLISGGAFLWSIAWGYEKLTGKEGMGFGDVKLVALFGAHSGTQGALISIFIGSMIGSLVGLFLIAFQNKNRRSAIPFGPFLTLGFLLYLLDMLHIVRLPLEWMSNYGHHF